MGVTVFWRYGSKEEVWHLYASCPELGRAPIDGTLCKGSVETAISTGRQRVCPVCRARYDRENPIENTLPTVRPAETKKEPPTAAENQKPIAKPEQKEKPEKYLWLAVAVFAVLCAWVWVLRSEPSPHSYNTTRTTTDSTYHSGTTTRATPRPTARPTATPKPTETPVSKDSYTVYITRTGSKYHRDGCQYLRSSKIEIDKKEAIENGYTACSKCKP